MAPTPLVVAYVGNFSHAHCTEVHVAASLEQLGHQVVRLQENTVNWRSLPRIVADRKAHMLLWTRTWAVDDEACLAALASLKNQGVPTVSYHLDRWWGLDREYQVATQPFFRTAMVWSPDGGNDHRWEEAGVNHRWIPPGVFGPECGLVVPDPGRFPHEVVFVGTYPYPHAEWAPYREALINRFADHYGDRFAVWPRDRRHAIRGRDLQTLYASARVVVGDSCLVGHPTRYWSDRIPETLGRGGLLIHPEVEGLDEWYQSDVDLITYPVGDFSAAVDACDALLANPEVADEIRTHGRETVVGRDTYAHRMTTVLNTVVEELGVPDWPARPARPVGRPRPMPVGRPRVGNDLAVRHSKSRHRGVFSVAQGDTDATAVREVWVDDTYRLEAGQVANGTVVDVGANVGAFSVLAAKLGARRVVAYEPHPLTGAVLEANITANGVAERVEVHHLAVAGEAGDLWLEGDGGGAHVGTGPLATTNGVLVTAVAINDILTQVGPVRLLKIDCEGGEYDIMAGLEGEHLTQVERIVMEFHGPGMPHLPHLGERPEAWGQMVTKLATYGRVNIFGRPTVGGLIWWERF